MISCVKLKGDFELLIVTRVQGDKLKGLWSDNPTSEKMVNAEGRLFKIKDIEWIKDDYDQANSACNDSKRIDSGINWDFSGYPKIRKTEDGEEVVLWAWYCKPTCRQESNELKKRLGYKFFSDSDGIECVAWKCTNPKIISQDARPCTEDEIKYLTRDEQFSTM